MCGGTFTVSVVSVLSRLREAAVVPAAARGLRGFFSFSGALGSISFFFRGLRGFAGGVSWRLVDGSAAAPPKFLDGGRPNSIDDADGSAGLRETVIVDA